jgi:acyl-CoA synthetase (AMP-forming)/AMP-acid ligase II
VLGEAIHAFVVSAPGSELSKSQVQAYCARKLPAFKRPEAIHFLQSLPHNSSGKVMKEELKKLLARSATEEPALT